jgi:hypothetical protein
MQRHVLVLDGSASTADNEVVDWNWTIESAANTVPPGTWTDTSNLTTSFSRGKTVRLSPPNAGPFRITLKVTDFLFVITVFQRVITKIAFLPRKPHPYAFGI